VYVRGIRALFAFEGYVVEKITTAADLAQVVLRRDGRYGVACPACGATMASNRTQTQVPQPGQPQRAADAEPLPAAGETPLRGGICRRCRYASLVRASLARPPLKTAHPVG
jgi:hypothetical protein